MFRIILSMINGASAARAIKLMFNGLVVSHESCGAAKKALEEFMECADVVLNVVDRGFVLGVVVILNTSSAMVAHTEVLQGHKSVSK